MSSLAEMATMFLAPEDRDAVLGDLAETGASGWSGVGAVLGLEPDYLYLQASL
jgi:hypothetical protein